MARIDTIKALLKLSRRIERLERMMSTMTKTPTPKRRDALALRGFNGNRIIERVAKTFLSENEMLNVDDATIIHWLEPKGDAEDVATLDDKARTVENLIIRARCFMKRIDKHLRCLTRLRSKLVDSDVANAVEQINRIDVYLSSYIVTRDGVKVFTAARLFKLQSRINTAAANLVKANFGQQLRQARLNLNLTAVDLSRKTGVDANVITSYERNQREPSINSLMVLSRVLNVTPNWLLTGSN